MVEGCWENDHPGRGLSVTFDSHIQAEPVPAVTGACLIIGRGIFEKIGGMCEDYVIGDFEDSDLCLRVQAEGLVVYYTPEVELYHLERQSMRFIGGGHVGWRQSLALDNMWKHSRRWGGVIAKVLESFVRPPGSEIVDHSPSGCDGMVDDDLPVPPRTDRVESVDQRSDLLLGRHLTKRPPARNRKRQRGGKA
jgi:hypothetical protein